MSREKPRCEECGLVKSAPIHTGYGDDKHDYLPPPRGGFGARKQALRPQSQRENRSQKRQETAQAMREYREAVRYCEGASYGAPGVCDGPLDVHHRIPRGSGGGKDFYTFARLCRKHHQWAEDNRDEARVIGLLVRKPPADLPPRRSVHIGE